MLVVVTVTYLEPCQKVIAKSCLLFSQNTPSQRLDRVLNPPSNYVFKINNRNTRTRCETSSKLKSLVLTLNMQMPAEKTSLCDIKCLKHVLKDLRQKMLKTFLI